MYSGVYRIHPFDLHLILNDVKNTTEIPVILCGSVHLNCAAYSFGFSYTMLALRKTNVRILFFIHKRDDLIRNGSIYDFTHSTTTIFTVFFLI